LIHRAFPPEGNGESGDRELRAVHEIAQALLASDGAHDIYTLALQRVTGLVGALFSCVFLRSDADETLLEPVATHRWPRQYRAYLEQTRVRIGRGPTGRAVSSREPVEAFDIHANPGLEEWWEPARELGFSSAVALPLVVSGEARGALTFYFAERTPPPAATRSLLLVVADQLAAAAEKAHLIEHLRAANLRLEGQNRELEVRIRESEEARRLKEEFLANISHELRTPLTAVLGYTDLLLDGVVDAGAAPRARPLLGRIREAALRLLSMIENLLDLTNVKLGRISPERQPCDAAGLAREALAAQSFPETAEVRSDLPEEPLPIHTDPRLVLRVLDCLLGNAAKFCPEGTITLRVRTDGRESTAGAEERVIWEVEDDGPGIPPEHLETIFDEFRQVDGSATRRVGGAGLGLALARAMATALDGGLRAHSEPGAGARFVLDLPRGEG
jgi:signal transduction histidine kinase